jgi:CheY-like chemotaxis protein
MPRLLLIIAEDDPFMREWLAITLQGIDARILQAENGHRLAALVASEPDVDLVISDIRMPGPSGLEVLARARSGGNPVPFLLITGYGGPDVLTSASALGAAVLQKPFSRRDLLACVDSVCRMRAAGGTSHGNLAHAADERD